MSAMSCGRMKPHAIGANDAPAPFSRYFFNFLFKPDSFLLPRFLETGGEDVDILIAGSDAVLECLGHCRYRNRNEDQVNRLGDGNKVGIGFQATNFGGIGVNRVDAPGEAKFLKATH